MKKIFILFLGAFLFASCSSDEGFSNEEKFSLKKKGLYLEKNLPKVLELSEIEIKDFKQSMEFNQENVLSSWDNHILRKAYKDNYEYNEIIIGIIHKLGGDVAKPIVIVNSSNKEYIIVNENSVLDFNMESNPLFKTIDEGIEPVPPGTYIFPDQKNRITTDGCKRDRGSTCVIKVT